MTVAAVPAAHTTQATAFFLSLTLIAIRHLPPFWAACTALISLLLTLARRLQRPLGKQDTLARLGGNQFALLVMHAHEATQIQMLTGMADSEERIARSRDRERQYQMLARTGRIADYLR